MEEILNRIKEHRKRKGFSYETMAFELGISTTAYRKIELNHSKLTLERLFQISKILDTEIGELLDIKPNNQLTQINNENSTGYLQQIENFHQESIEKSEKIEALYEARLKDKDLVINQLQINIDYLSAILKK